MVSDFLLVVYVALKIPFVKIHSAYPMDNASAMDLFKRIMAVSHSASLIFNSPYRCRIILHILLYSCVIIFHQFLSDKQSLSDQDA